MKLLIVGPSWVGDAVMAQTLYKLIKDSNKDAQIEVLSSNWSMPILERMEEVSRSITSPFNHGELKLKARFDFGKQLREEGYDLVWKSNNLDLRHIPLPHTIKEKRGKDDLLFWMRESGCYQISISLESGSPNTFKRMKRPTNLEHAVIRLHEMRKYGFDEIASCKFNEEQLRGYLVLELDKKIDNDPPKEPTKED